MKLLEPQLPTINLFKVTRTRAWWPFARAIDAGRYIQAVMYHKTAKDFDRKREKEKFWLNYYKANM